MKHSILILAATLSLIRLHGQCTACTPDDSRSPRPFGFNPPALYVRPNTDTTLVIYFTFPDGVQFGNLTVYPNYAIWVDSLRLDRGLITLQNGQPFKYDASNPDNGGIQFNQLHRHKNYDPSDPGKTANFVVYQNPGGTAGQTPPIGCARVCIKGGAQTGSDTLRVKVRAFVSVLGDGANKDTANINGTLGRVDTIFRYAVVVTPNIPSSLAGRSPSSISFKLTPNPSFGETNIRFELNKLTHLTIRAVALDGREVYRHAGLYEPGSHAHALRLPAGVYLVSLQEEGHLTYTQQLVVLE
ncbi:MAG: T9SS type A sorting domain-containing protein [Bacteroidia bacterium]|nr:T9SS type A sorting domain-containing protein [Bacteroidia bacterium]